MKFYYGLSAAIIGAAIVMVQPQVAVPQTFNEQDIGTLAKEVTVVINGQNPGSGVIISKQGNIYYALTAKHVVATQDEYEILTADGTKHKLDYRTVKKLPNVDLAIVQFTSNQNYRVAELGDSDSTKEGATIYISGWPHPGPALTERIYQITSGTMSGRPLAQLPDGYELVYTNVTRSGMSGGPIFDSSGRVIGIHGRADGEPVFNPETGQTVNVKSGFNLGIPIKTFFEIASASDIPPTASFAEPLTILGNRLRSQNRLPEAVAYYERAIAQDGKFVPARYFMGLVKYQQGDAEAAINQWKSAIEIDGEKISPKLALAAALYAKGDRDRSLQVVSDILESKGLYTDADVPDWEKIKENLWGDRLLANMQQLLGNFVPTKTWQGFSESLEYLAFSADGKSAIGITKENRNPIIKIWNTSTGELQNTIKLNVEGQTFAVSSDMQTIAVATDYREMTIWNLRTGELKNKFKSDALPSTIYEIVFSPDDRTLAIASSSGLHVWNWRTGQPVYEKPNSEFVRSVAFSADGQTLASGVQDGSINLWNATTGELKNTLKEHSSAVLYLAFSPDGKTLASDSDRDRGIKLWNLSNGQLLHTLKETFGPMVFTPDSAILATSGMELWKVATAEKYRRFRGGESPLAISQDGKFMASTSEDGTIKIWSLKSSN